MILSTSMQFTYQAGGQVKWQDPLRPRIWDEFGLIWRSLGDTPPVRARTINELIALMAFEGPNLSGFERKRWTVLYHTAVWSLWRAYLSHSFSDLYAFWHPVAARA